MKYTFFVLDFDGTYNNEPKGSLGVTPSVYLIKQDELPEVERYAEMASKDFNSATNDMANEDIFEEWMDNNNIFYDYIGDIGITFEERQSEYLPNYIPRQVV